MNAEANRKPPSMWRRMALVIAFTALIGLVAASWFRIHEVVTDRNRIVTDRVSDSAQSMSREVRGRLELADAMVRYLTSGDGGAGGALLRERMLSTDAFNGVALLPFKESSKESARAGSEQPEPMAGLAPISPGDRLKLRAGQSLLALVTPEDGHTGIYLIHQLTVANSPQLGLFELDPGWLWQGAEELPDQDSMVVIDAAEHLVFEGAALPPELLRLFARAPLGEHAPARLVLRDWQQGGAAWRGALVQLDMQSAHLGGDPWNVVVYGQLTSAGPAALSLIDDLWPLLLLAAAAVCFATWYLAGRWQTVLTRLDAALEALRHGKFQRVGLHGAADTPRAVAQSYNLAITALESKWSAQERLAEIDRLLLEATDLEQSIEPILLRVCALTCSQVAAVALLDRDAPGHARSFVAGADGAVCPVSRINLEEDSTLSLQDAPQGIAVQPHHLERYGFLQPLRERGAEICYVWPIFAGSEVAAMLSVGYRGITEPSQELVGYGAQCTSRLQIALSNQDCDARLYRQAHFDSLTSLPNRVLFRDRLSRELASTTDGSARGALLYVDLDHFKRVNDTVGHSAGDQLLTVVAQRLRSCVKDGDTVARLGGDEFTVLLRQVPSAEAANEIAQRIIDSLQRPVNIAGRDHQVRASIGITRFPEDGTTIDDLLRNADLAMYQAKDSGRSRAVFFDSKMARASTQLAESGLYRAVRRREFALYYQPQYALKNGELVALEALVRWQHPREGLRFPKDFVPAAEQSGLIVEIGTWVLESACRQLAMWREEGIAPSRLALNVSLQQLRGGEFVQLVSDTLARMSLPPQTLEFEVTETVFAEEDGRLALRNLAALGVRVALDDFGTGYSSLNYLRQHPVDAIKIDRSFMSEVPDNYQATTLLATIIDMAHALGKQVVAEGVETLPQLDYLRERGCDVAQGFVLARPLNVADVTERLAQRSGSTALLRRAIG
jgi:diguanylate cyclase (GGDEF)-like protein